MATRYFALIFGIVYALIGILGFIPGFTTPLTEHNLMVDDNAGLLFGLFPVNLLHNLVHLLVGLLGIVAFRTFGAARNYGRFLAIAFGLLTILGLVPGLETLFGLVPLYGNDVWLHALTALAGIVFGWLVRPENAYIGAGDTTRNM